MFWREERNIEDNISVSRWGSIPLVGTFLFQIRPVQTMNSFGALAGRNSVSSNPGEPAIPAHPVFVHNLTEAGAIPARKLHAYPGRSAFRRTRKKSFAPGRSRRPS